MPYLGLDNTPEEGKLCVAQKQKIKAVRESLFTLQPQFEVARLIMQIVRQWPGGTRALLLLSPPESGPCGEQGQPRPRQLHGML